MARSSNNGAPRQRAIITITDRGDGKFNANLQFEPSIAKRGHFGGKFTDPAKKDNPAVQAAWFCWNKLKEQQLGHIILTDER